MLYYITTLSGELCEGVFKREKSLIATPNGIKIKVFFQEQYL